MKGVVLAGGQGSRLYPATQIISKQLTCLYDKPVIYYPLSVLMAANIRDICIVCDTHCLSQYRALLGDGSQFGINLSFVPQLRANGVAEAPLLCAQFLGQEPFCLILGDNVFSGSDSINQLVTEWQAGCHVFAYRVKNVSPYGEIRFDSAGKVTELVEKPAGNKPGFAVPGFYLFDNTAIDRAKCLQPSRRGELEIVDLLNTYLDDELLIATKLTRGFAWLDVGTPASLLSAANYIATIEERQGQKIGAPEEVALKRGFISKQDFNAWVSSMPTGHYQNYLLSLLDV